MVDTEMDVRLLKSRIVLEGLTQEELINKAELNKNKFYRTLKGEDEFDRIEIIKISETLNLANKDIIDIFFRQKVS